MSHPEIVQEEALSVYDALKEIKAIKKRDEDVSLRVGRCEEFINNYSPLSEKAAGEIKKKILELDIPRLRDEHICKLIDVLPVSEDDIKMVLSRYSLTIKAENVAKIEAVFAEYRKK